MSIVLSRRTYRDVKDLMTRDLYNETCGCVLRDMLIPMDNIHPSPRSNFAFEGKRQLEVWTEWGGVGDLIVYHTHPRGTAFPSQTDIAAARDPRIHYWIYSLSLLQDFFFRVDAGRVVREDLTVVD